MPSDDTSPSAAGARALTAPAALVTHARRYAGPPAVRALLARGYRVLAHDPGFSAAESGDSAAESAAARDEFQRQFPDATLLAATEPESAVEEAVATGRLEVLVANQLFAIPAAPIDEVNVDAVRGVFEALVMEPWRWVRAAVPPLRRGGGGRIVLVTSAAGRRPGGRVVAYSAARAAANAAVAGLAKELGPDAIAITAIAPNWFASPDTFPPERMATDPHFRERVQRLVPLGRLSAPGEMEALISYLTSPEAAFVTGEVIGFSGGWL